MSVMYCHTFVSPGIGATLHTFFFRRVFMTDDLPVLGLVVLSVDGAPSVSDYSLPNKAHGDLLSLAVKA
jgi:hypothetical protein